MRPATLRRLLVFGVCAVGTATLYVAPSLAGTSPTLGRWRSEPAEVLAAADPVVVRAQTVNATLAPDAPDAAAADPAGRPRVRSAALSAEHVTLALPTPDPLHPAATPFVPGSQPDQTPPGPVAATVTATSWETFLLSWPPAIDDTRVVAYRIEVNGYHRLTTGDLQAQVPWYPGDEDVSFVRVLAEDAAGNQTTDSPGLLIRRPAPPPPPPPPAPPPTTVSPMASPTGSRTVSPRPGTQAEVFPVPVTPVAVPPPPPAEVTPSPGAGAP